MLESRTFHSSNMEGCGEALVSLNRGAVDGHISIENAKHFFTQFYFHVCSALK